MPVRGHGHYKRPYRIRFTEPSGRIVNKAYHWSGPWQAEVSWLFLHKWSYKAWKAAS